MSAPQASDSSSSSVVGSRVRVASSQSTHGDVFRVESESGARRQHAATRSSDDDDDAGTELPIEAAVPARRAHQFTVDASEAQTFRPPSPRAPAAKKLKKTVRISAPKRVSAHASHSASSAKRRLSTAELVAQRNVARASARSALDALRTGQAAPQVQQSGAAPIRNYNDTPQRSARADADRNVVIDGELFDSLRYDSAREFQDANRPPWAAPVNDKQLNQLMTWESLEVMSELEQRTKDWYTLALMVAGLVQVKAEAFVVFRPKRGPQPTRQSVLGGYALPKYARAPAREPELRVPEPQAPVERPAPEPTEDDVQSALDAIDQAGGLTDSFDDETVLAPQQPPTRPGTPAAEPGRQVPATPALGDQSLGGARSIFTKARFPQFRRQQQQQAAAAQAQVPMAFYSRGFVPESDSTPISRNQIANAAPWASRSLATGVFFLAPEYTAARDTAHMLIVSRADHLASVELAEFVRDGSSASVQHRVRVQFARLIAHMYNIAKHNANRSSKLAHDMANYTAGAEQIVLWFVKRINYEPRSRTFSDAGTRYARDHQRLGPMNATVGAFTQTRSDDRLQIYGTKPVIPLDPLLYTPGTLLSPITNNNNNN